MGIFDIILENFTTICLLIGIGILIGSNKSFDDRTNRSFIIFVLITFLVIVAGSIEQLCSYESEPSFLRYFCSSLGYVLRPTSIVLLINILLRRRKTNYYIWIPIIILAIISFSTYHTHLMYFYYPNNYFSRGPFGYLSHYISLIYVIALLILIIKKHNYITYNE